MKKMENLVNAKNFLCSGVGVLGGVIFGALGGYTHTLQFLLGIMVLDYILGIAIAVLKLSPKSKTGGLNSSVGFRGLLKKVGILVMVWIGFQIDLSFNLNVVRNMVILGFLANEVISVIENLGLIGVVKNEAVIKMIDILKKQTNTELMESEE